MCVLAIVEGQSVSWCVKFLSDSAFLIAIRFGYNSVSKSLNHELLILTPKHYFRTGFVSPMMRSIIMQTL